MQTRAEIAASMKAKGMSVKAIAEVMGLRTDSVRAMIWNAEHPDRYRQTMGEAKKRYEAKVAGKSQAGTSDWWRARGF